MDKTRADREQELKSLAKTDEGQGYIKQRFLGLLSLPTGRSVVPLKSFNRMITDILDQEFPTDEQAIQSD